MQVKQLSFDLVRERLPQLLQVARDHFGKLPLKRPSWPVHSTAAHWISWRMVLAAALLGGIVHIGATFTASVYHGGTAFRLLVDKLPPNRMTVLPPQAPGRQILSELPPDMLYAMCRYDLREGSVAVRANVLGPGWALSVHTPLGTNIYVLTGQPARRTDVSFLIVPSAPDAVPMPRGENAGDAQIASPTLEGLVVLRGPIRGLAWTAEVEAILRSASCTQVRQ